MKRLIALDNEEFDALNELALAAASCIPTYQTLNLSQGLFYVFDTDGTEEIEKLLILGARMGLISP